MFSQQKRIALLVVVHPGGPVGDPGAVAVATVEREFQLGLSGRRSTRGLGPRYGRGGRLIPSSRRARVVEISKLGVTLSLLSQLGNAFGLFTISNRSM